MHCPKCDVPMEPGGLLHHVHICPQCHYLTTAPCIGCGDCLHGRLAQEEGAETLFLRITRRQ